MVEHAYTISSMRSRPPARHDAHFERALRLLDDVPRGAAYPHIHLGQLDLLQGDWKRGGAQVEAAIKLTGPKPDLWLLPYGQRLLAERELLDGKPAAALAHLGPLIHEPGARVPQVTLLFAPLAWSCLEVGQEDEAEAVLA